MTQVEDETLTSISSLPGAPDVQSLIEANRDIYRGITAKSKLMTGTQIFLRPIEEKVEEVKTKEEPVLEPPLPPPPQKEFKTVWNGATPALGTTVEALWASGSDPQYPGYLLANVHSVSKDPESGRTFLHLIYHDGGEDTEVPIQDIRSVRNNTGSSVVFNFCTITHQESQESSSKTKSIEQWRSTSRSLW